MSQYFVLDKIICNVYISLYLTRSSVVFINFFPTPTVVNAIIRISWPLVEACVAEWLTPRTPDLEVRDSSLAYRVVSLDKELYSTLSLFTQVYKWVPATYCWGITLRWTSIPSRGESQYSFSTTSWSLTQSWTRQILKL